MIRCFVSRFALIGLSIGYFSPAAWGEVKLPAVIGSHMVLESSMPLTIWGWASPDEEVTVAIGDTKATTKADDNGDWIVKLPSMKECLEPLEMTISGTNTIQLTDILVGEVWIGSGQSNMQWAVRDTNNASEEIAAADYPKIRLFSVPLVPSGTPARDVQAAWTVCSPQSVPGFSAVCYYFGRELHKQLNVPVGMIASSWGGTRIQPWIPPAGYEAVPELEGERKETEGQRAGYQAALKNKLPELKSWLEQADKAVAAGEPIGEPPAMPGNPFNSSNGYTGLYNGMIHPIAPFAIRGALWYQGESNVGQGMHYYDLMRGLILGWRNVWSQGDFPFLFVQLAPFNYGGNPQALPEIWEAQTATLKVPLTGMAVTTDISDVRDIHPRNKQEVGRRLALWRWPNTMARRTWSIPDRCMSRWRSKATAFASSFSMPKAVWRAATASHSTGFQSPPSIRSSCRRRRQSTGTPLWWKQPRSASRWPCVSAGIKAPSRI